MDFLTVKETAQLLRVSPITVRRYIASGQLAAERVGRGIRVRREAIETFVSPIEPASARRRTNAHAYLGVNDDEEGDPDSDELLDKPFIFEDPLWEIVGIGRSDGPNDVTSNKHKYMADAIFADKFGEE